MTHLKDYLYSIRVQKTGISLYLSVSLALSLCLCFCLSLSLFLCVCARACEYFCVALL